MTTDPNASERPDAYNPNANPESVDNFADGYITKRFRAIFEDDSNADISRAFVVGLAVNDPAVEIVDAEIVDAEVVEEYADVLDDDGEVIEHTGTADCPACAALYAEEYQAEGAFGYSGLADDVISFSDGDGDRVSFGYFQADPGGESAVVIHVNAAAMILPIGEVPLLVSWLYSRGLKAASAAITAIAEEVDE